MPEHFCQEHHVPFRKFEKEGKVWYAHKNGDKWCNEPKDASVVSEEAPTIEKPRKDSNSRSFALSYAKDFAIARINKGVEVKSIEILQIADLFRK